MNVPPRLTKQRSDRFLCLSLTLILLVAWAVLSNRFSSQAAAPSSSSCSEPSFLTAEVVHRFDFPEEIVSGDFNSDHHADVVILTGTDVAVVLGDGAGNFATPTFFPAGPFMTFLSMAVADVNGDGKLDVIRTGHEDSSLTKGELSVLLGDGAGSFAVPKSFQTDGHFGDIVLGDWNGDSKLDLAASAESGVWVMQGDGTGAFGAEVRYQTAGVNLTAIKMADFNGDDKTDLVTVRPNADKVSVLLNDGNGLFSTEREFATSTRPFELLAGDFNGDGKADVVTGSSNSLGANNISVLLGDGAGNLAAPINTPTDSMSFLSSGDFNGDGKPDLMKVSSPGPLGILLGDGTGHFSVPREFNPANFSTRLEAVAVDFDEDGKLDVATNYMTISLGDGAGNLSAARSVRAGNDPASIAAGDFNEDGRRDLVVANSGASDVSLLIQDATGGYGPATSVAVGLRPRFVAVADFNGDHHLDFVTANSFVDFGKTNVLSTVSIRLGDGTGNFAPPRDFPSGYNPDSLVVVDVNQDGKLDLVVANEGSVVVSEVIFIFPASVSILIGDGAGNFAAPRALSTELPNLGDALELSIAAGDMNNDSKVDLVVTHRKNVSVLLGDGTGQFAAAITHASAKIANSMVAGDFNEDGNLDVAMANGFTDGQSTDTVSIRLGDGAGNLGAANDLVVASDPLHIAAGDFNLDSNLDLAVSNGAPVSVMPGDGAGSFGARTAFNVGARSATVADLNGDGKPDLATTPSGIGIQYITILLNTCGGLVSPTPTPTPTPTATPTPTPTPSPGPVLLVNEVTNEAIALDSVTLTRGPFAVRTWFNFSPDQRTRILLFASNLELLPGEDASVVTAQVEDAQAKVVPLVVENVAKVPGFDWLTQVVVKLPDELEGAGNVQVSISLRGSVSNKGVITIKASSP